MSLPCHLLNLRFSDSLLIGLKSLEFNLRETAFDYAFLLTQLGIEADVTTLNDPSGHDTKQQTPLERRGKKGCPTTHD